MKVQGIILAAGLSSRAKTYKMTLEFKGKTVIESTLDNMLKFCEKVFVVGGYQIERLQPIIKGYKNVELLYNEDYMEGMYSSVKKGISAVNAERFFFTPGDYPLISCEVYQELLKYRAPVVIPSFEGRKGHPILFEGVAIKEMLGKTEFMTLREVVASLEAVIVPVECRGVIMDLDTMEDYELLQEQLDKGVSTR